jgi:hypothetical protein
MKVYLWFDAEISSYSCWGDFINGNFVQDYGVFERLFTGAGEKVGQRRSRNGVLAIQPHLDDNNSHLRIKMDWP